MLSELSANRVNRGLDLKPKGGGGVRMGTVYVIQLVLPDIPSIKISRW